MIPGWLALVTFALGMSAGAVVGAHLMLIRQRYEERMADLERRPPHDPTRKDER